VCSSDLLRLSEGFNIPFDAISRNDDTMYDEYRRMQKFQHRADVRAIADVLARDNGRFDRGRFYRAAGAPELEG
jgi:hypothetical protein